MNFSLPPMLLYGIILFAAIATGMENKESDQVAPNVIEIKGRIGLNSDVINGYYFKADELYNGRVYYHNQYKSCYVLWNKTFQCWYIYHQDIQSMALLEEDVLFPTLAKEYWIFDDGVGEEWNVDADVVVEKIDTKDAPDVIRIKGRIGSNSDVINGYYFKADEIYNERVYYQNKLKSTFVSWNRKSQCWSIDRGFGSIRYMAKLQEDVLFPTLATKYWIFFDGAGKGRKKDENVVVEKIDDRRTLLILQDPEILTVTLEPRPLGLRANWTTGTGITVNSDCQTQLKQLGTGEDWEIYLVDFEPYNEPLLDEKMKGDKSYDLSFIKKIKKETETLRKI